MEPSIITYLIMALIVLGINVVPALMPATWTILVYFFLTYNLSFIPTILIGASMATCGRIILYTISRYGFYKLLSDDGEKNYADLGKYLDKHQKFALPVIVAYAFLPIPSNQVFIAAGLAQFDIKLLAFSFFLGRLISYSFWVGITSQAARSLESAVLHDYADWGKRIIEVFGIVTVFGMSFIKWHKILPREKTTFGQKGRH